MTDSGEALSPAVRDSQLEVAGFSLAVREFGPADAQPVLALHGWMDHADSFLPLAPLLSDCRVVALDLPGHGLTEFGSQGNWFHYIDNVPLVFQVLNALNIDRCHLLGHSMGGGLVALLAAALPDRVASMVSIDMLGPITGEDDQVVKQLRKGVLDRSGGMKQRYFATRDDAVAARLNSHFPLKLCEILAHRGVIETDRGYTWRGDRRLKWSTLLRMNEARAQEVLQAIRCPTLVLMAEQQRYPQMVEKVAARQGLIPNEQVITAPGGHHLHMEYPDVCADHINTFYRGLEG